MTSPESQCMVALWPSQARLRPTPATKEGDNLGTHTDLGKFWARPVRHKDGVGPAGEEARDPEGYRVSYRQRFGSRGTQRRKGRKSQANKIVSEVYRQGV